MKEKIIDNELEKMEIGLAMEILFQALGLEKDMDFRLLEAWKFIKETVEKRKAKK